MIKKGFVAMLYLIALVGLTANAYASTFAIEDIRYCETPSSFSPLVLNKGQTCAIEVELRAFEQSKDIKVQITLEHEQDVIKVSTNPFNLPRQTTSIKTLAFTVPSEIDEGTYLLKVKAANKDTIVEQSQTIKIESKRQEVTIKDVTLSELYLIPNNILGIGVHIENTGSENQQNIKVQAYIPELNLKAATYIQNIKANEIASADTLKLQLPSNLQEEAYNLVISVSYANLHQRTTQILSLVPVKDQETQIAPSQTTKEIQEENTQPEAIQKLTIIFIILIIIVLIIGLIMLTRE